MLLRLRVQISEFQNGFSITASSIQPLFIKFPLVANKATKRALMPLFFLEHGTFRITEFLKITFFKNIFCPFNFRLVLEIVRFLEKQV
jgi:hypothetical protein